MFRTPKAPATPRKPKKSRGADAVQSEGSGVLHPSLLKEDDAGVYQGVCTSKQSIKTSPTSSTAARRLQLELEAAEAKAQMDIEVAEAEAKAAEAKAHAAKVKADLRKEVLNKQLAADFAELESQSRHSRSASVASGKVEQWLDKTTDHVPENSQESDIQKLAYAIRDAVAISTKENNQQLLTRLATSKDLPVYYGDPIEWLQFKEAYLESTALCRYSGSENLWRLRKCLRGDAKEAVTSLLIGGVAPEVIIETLELRFGKPETIMNKILSQLKKLQPLPSAYQSDLIGFAVKIRNYVTAAKALKQSDYLRSPELLSVIVTKLPTILVAKWTDHLYEKQHTSCELSKLEMMSEFLYTEATKIAVSGVSHIHTQPVYRKNNEKDRKVHSHSILHTTGAALCKFCRKGEHNLPDCTRFKRAMRKDRWNFARKNNLCFKCLLSRHADPTACSARNCNIDGCDQPHHRLLHWLKQSAPGTDTNRSEKAKHTEADEDQNEIITHAVTSPALKVLLKVVPLTIHGPAGSQHAHALLDDGATISLISAELADQLGLHGRRETMRARCAWNNSELVCQSELVNVDISNSDGEQFKFSARKIRELNLPVQHVSEIAFHKYGLSNSDIRLCDCDARPMLLIGQDNHHLITPEHCYRSEQHGPYVTKTPLGWCVHGRNSVSDPIHNPESCVYHNYSDKLHNIHSIFHLCTIQPAELTSEVDNLSLSNRSLDKCKHCCVELHEEVRKSFMLDSIGIGIKPRSNPDHLRAIQILDSTAILRDGQWYVGLPWKSDNICMPDSFTNAYKRLKYIQKKMSMNSNYAFNYSDRIAHLLSNGYAKELVNDSIDNCNDKRIWYLPHFGVQNPNKSKIRLVFDAAAKSNDLSLNDFLLTGPDLLQSLLGIMFRFRENRIGIIGDIQDMFLRIKIRDEDTHALRFLWQDEPVSQERPLSSNDHPQGSSPPKERPIKVYLMTSLIFGACCSPFIAQYVNQIKNTQRFEQTMPNAVSAIRQNQYMDNYIDSVHDVPTAIKMVKEISFINKRGNFIMRDWQSNDVNVLKCTPLEILSDKAVRFNIENQFERTLGLLWFPDSDSFAFDLSLKRIHIDILNYVRKPTKREVLSIVMSIYDMHGFLSPFTVKSKIILQEVWRIGIGWDDKINDTLYIEFKKWLIQLKTISDIRIPRWYFAGFTNVTNTASVSPEVDTSLQLHLFSDGSPRAYSAVAYWRKLDDSGRVLVSFIASKNRVAPLKPMTIPRLELQGALLSCRLAETIKREHRIKPSATYYWVDSTIVYYWIKNKHRNYKIFISNRLGEIDETSNSDEWHYVPTDMNIADLGTKFTDYNLCSDSNWFTGPSFLYESPERWPQQPETYKRFDKDLVEEVPTVLNTHRVTYPLPVPDTERFSSWIRLLRSTATVLLFINKCRASETRQINQELMHKAEVLLLRSSQTQSFSKEIDLLSEEKPVDRNSRLRTLTPFIDSLGLMRVGGRINAAAHIVESMKNPIILDGRHHTTRLIVKHYHERAAHSFNELVVNELRQTYWIINLRPTVRSIASRCLICRIRKATPIPPRMGNLPADRFGHHQRPFTMCAADLFGPLVVTVGRQKPKRYGVLFTCLTVRAIHIEIVPTLTADSLIMALRRMAARRGWPNTIISDNGTNMRGADVELRKSFQELDKVNVQNEVLNQGVTWKFISPASPHMGGAWERLIRTVKTALKVVLKERSPREEVLTTLLAEVENIVNSRPLTHVCVDPRSQEALTPNHFLLGSSSNLPVPGVFADGDFYLRRQWRIAQRLTDLFWHRWVREALPLLIPRHKWTCEGQQLKVGDLVVVVDPSSPRNCWPRGLIVKVYPGNDGRVRVVDIRTRSGIMRRPATRVAILQVDDECRKDDTGEEDVDDVHAARPET